MIARGDNFADCVSVSAAAGYGEKMPIMLADQSGLSEAQLAEIRKIAPGHIVIVGGESAVPASIETGLKNAGYTVSRVSGATRYETSAEIARYFNMNSGKAILATGSTFPDGLTGGVLGARIGAPVLLVGSDAASSENAAAKAFIKDFSVNSLYVIGGTAAVTEETLNGICCPE